MEEKEIYISAKIGCRKKKGRRVEGETGNSGESKGRGGWGGEEGKREVKEGDKFDTCAPDVSPFIWSRPIRLTPSGSLPPPQLQPPHSPPPSFLLGCTAEDSHLDLKCSKRVARRSGGGEGEGVGGSLQRVK